MPREATVIDKSFKLWRTHASAVALSLSLSMVHAQEACGDAMAFGFFNGVQTTLKPAQNARDVLLSQYGSSTPAGHGPRGAQRGSGPRLCRPAGWLERAARRAGAWFAGDLPQREPVDVDPTVHGRAGCAVGPGCRAEKTLAAVSRFRAACF